MKEGAFQCPYSGVIMAEGACSSRMCPRCGWNPAVHEDRVSILRRRGAKTLCGETVKAPGDLIDRDEAIKAPRKLADDCPGSIEAATAAAMGISVISRLPGVWMDGENDEH